MENITSMLPLLLLLFCFINTDYVPNSCARAQPVDCLASDREALIDFKNGLDDPDNRLSSWSGRKCCQWHGISCENSTGAVVAIDLPGNPPVYFFPGLSSEIRPSLMKLKSLRRLDLSSNSFHEIPIPASFGSLENLHYLNLSNAGFGGQIPPNFGNLSHLKFLDLSYLSLDVENLRWVTGLVSLEHLALDSNNLSLVGADWLSAINELSSLTELHLSGCQLSGHIPSLPSLNFTSLAVVDLSMNNFVSEIPDWLLNITSLQHIDMSNNYLLYGRIPLGFGELPNLMSLSLSGNQNLTASCSQLLKGRWEKIHVLVLSNTMLHGKLPSSFGNLTSLVHLDLSSSAVEGGIPGSIGKLCNLNEFYISGSKITGNLPQFLEGADNCLSKKPLPNLQQIYLAYNQLSGKIPDWLGKLENLAELSLDNNLLEGPIPVSLGSLQSLTELTLSANKLNGTLPESIGQLSELYVLAVSHNQLTGTITEAHFSKLSKLKYLYLSSNSFTMNFSSNWVPPFRVIDLYMGSCVLGPSFPAWLKSQNEVEFLDSSNASISGSIPYWFWDLSSHLSDFNLSHNELQGQLPNPIPASSSSLSFISLDLSFNHFKGPVPLRTSVVDILDLSYNCFSGPIPRNIGHIIPDMKFLSLSHNKLHGAIPLSLGEMSFLQLLDLSNNNLIGRVPPSLANCSSLQVLILGSNNLFGTFPDSLGQLVELRSLHLSDNHFSGSLPSYFRNLSNLETIDLGNNGFSGIIPPWLGDCFSSLRILRLRSNAFYGELPHELSNLSSLQVLDLARNNLLGSIPPRLGYLKAISEEQKINKYFTFEDYGAYFTNVKFGGKYHEESLVVTTKGRPLEYTKTLFLVTSIDLSDNHFTGHIPIEITKLSGLVILNLSRNHLTGQIPQGMSKLHQLSSLDLSSNQLSGTIPTSLSSLSFMGYLNLSNNNLSGAIPYEGHMTTFNDESCFAGNPGLCGPPLHVRCPGDDDDVPSQGYNNGKSEEIENEDGLIDKWFYLSLGLGFAAGILVPFFIFAIKRSWGGVYFAIVDQVAGRILRLRHGN